MPKNNITLEECIIKEQQMQQERLSVNAGHIAKLIGKLNNASDDSEKKRLSDLIQLHRDHKVEIENIDINAAATKKFNQLQDVQP